MIKRTFFSLIVIALMLSTILTTSAFAETSYEGKVVKLEDGSTLWYIASDGKRYVYPNEKAYKSWFNDFSDVVTITEEELAEYELAGNIRYRPGVVLVKIQTDPKVYAVSKGGVLRWIKTEGLARKLYGEYWASLIDDIAASFFANYTVGDDVDDEGDYDPDEETNENDTVEENRGLKIGHLSEALKARTRRCRAIPASPHEGRRRAISARVCKLNIINEGSEEPEEPDETPPVISDVSVTVATSTATITWTTDEEANSKVEYATESLATATTSDILVELDNDLVTDHSIELTNLTATTTYYFMVQSADANSNIATSTEDTFTTEE